MPIPLFKKKPRQKLYTIKERRHVKKTKTPRHLGKTKDVRFIQDGFMSYKINNPRDTMNHPRKVVK